MARRIGGRSMNKKTRKYVVAMFLTFIFCICVGVGFNDTSKADGNEILISNEDELRTFVSNSKSNSYEGYTIKLINDIALENAGDKDYINIGSSDVPFKGTFDGAGHTISGIYNEKTILPTHDNGLFAWTDGAVIKNLNIDNARVTCAYRGGILTGHSINTVIENITISNSVLKIQPANNVVSVITNTGFSGGAISGSTDNSVLYNCEVRGTEVVNNSTQGVGALGGEGLYMGGLVGSASSSIIEYCRMVEDSKVRNEYDVAVGALGGKAIYVGGIVGEMKDGSKVIDTFSTADVYFYCATYVAVGAGNAGYAGGIAAAMYGDNCQIVRSHYAGNIHSRQYNAVLVIPIIQNDVNISGIAQSIDGSHVYNSYFKRSASSTTKTIRAINDDADTQEAKAATDTEYTDRNFWKSKGYDLTGTVARETDSRLGTHYNKWVMDIETGMPVHGKSVSVAIDFPEAGSVTIGNTALVNASVSTSDPYNFAIQGINSYEENVNISTEATTIDGHTDAYKFVGWYLKQNELSDSVDQIKKYYETITGTTGNLNTPVSTDKTYTPTVTDNDLYVAHYQANVIYHDVDGNIINNSYYNYQDSLPNILVTVPDGCTFYGWTTRDNSGKGYTGIISDVLESIKEDGEFYQVGDSIEKPLKLYPIFTNYISNIHTIFEGHELDTIDAQNVRDGVGQTSIGVNDSGEVYIQVTPVTDFVWEDNGYHFLGWYEILSDAAGTYEVLVSKDEQYILKTVDLTKEHTYIARFTYDVEYWVKGDLRDDQKYDESNNPPGGHYTTISYRYKEGFQSIAGPVLYNQTVTYWCNDGYNGTQIGAGTEIQKPMKVYSNVTGSGSGVVHPSVIVETDFPNSATFKDIDIDIGNNDASATVVPNAGYQFGFWTWERQDGDVKGVEETERLSNKNILSGSTDRRFMGIARMVANVTFHNISGNETVTRRYQEPVLLEKAVDPLAENLYKFYYDALQDTNLEEIFKNDVATDKQDSIRKLVTSEATPQATPQEGYTFLGWIYGNNLTDKEKSYIYGDTFGSTYVTDKLSKAAPYIITDTDIVVEPMDLYPVYIKLDIIRTTNIKETGVIEGAGINIPIDPKFKISDETLSDETLKAVTINENGLADFTLVVDTETKVTNEPDSALYEFKYLECIHPDGTVERLTPETDGKTFIIKDVDLGQTYKYIAYYEPLTVVYHVKDGNDASSLEVVTRNTNQRLGTFDGLQYKEAVPSEGSNGIGVDNGWYSFVGWTTEQPNVTEHNYYLLSDYSNIDSIPMIQPSYVVTKSIELYPVYAPITVNVISNQDSVSGIDVDSLRGRTRDTDTGEVTVWAKNTVTVNGTKYVFSEWKVNGETVSEETTIGVPKDQFFTGISYEAYYNIGYEVRYHNLKGDVIYTAEVLDSENRSFVYETTNSQGETVTVPYDVEAFINIMNSLADNQYFGQ